MRKNYWCSLFLLSVAFFDSAAAPKSSSDGRDSDLGEDFPRAERLRFKSVGKYKIAEERGGEFDRRQHALAF